MNITEESSDLQNSFRKKSRYHSFFLEGADPAVILLTTKVVRAIVLLCPSTHRLAELTNHHGESGPAQC